jgi:hypothetical protein
MTDKLPSYIEFTPQTDDNCAAYDVNGGGDGCDLSYTDDNSTENGNYNARDYGHWRGGGENTSRDVACEDIDAMKRMVHDMLRNPEFLYVSPLYSEIFGSDASSSTQDGSMTVASCGAAAVSHASPASFPMECEREDLEAMKRMVHDMLRNPELLHMSPLYSEIVGGVASSSTQDVSMTVASSGGAAVSHASPSSSHLKCDTTFMLVTPTTATKTTMPMSPRLCQERHGSVPPPPPLPVRTSPTRTVTIPWAPPLPFH